jgi:hypothetical protein
MEKLMHNKRFVFLSLGVVGVILCLVVVACSHRVTTTVTTGSGLSVTPFESIKLNVTPGEKTTQQLTVSLGIQSTAMKIAVDVMGFGSSPSGSPQVIEPAEDTGQYTARLFITLSKSSFELKPGESQNIIARISVPANVGAGGRFALIYIHQQIPAGGTGAGSASAFNIPVLLTIEGSTLTQTGKITALSASGVTSGQPIWITTEFQNTGNVYFKAEGNVAVINAQGQTVDTLSIPLTASSIIPGATRQILTNFTPTSALAVGTYTIDSKVMLQDGTLMDESTSTFAVTTEYVPPVVTP